jgi:hypothetical protein
VESPPGPFTVSLTGTRALNDRIARNSYIHLGYRGDQAGRSAGVKDLRGERAGRVHAVKDDARAVNGVVKDNFDRVTQPGGCRARNAAIGRGVVLRVRASIFVQHAVPFPKTPACPGSAADAIASARNVTPVNRRILNPKAAAWPDSLHMSHSNRLLRVLLQVGLKLLHFIRNRKADVVIYVVEIK